MTSKVLDLTTIGHALNELCDAYLGDTEWKGINDQQHEFLTWYVAHREEIRKLADLEALASTDFAKLNEFLQAHGFDPMFQPFDGIGVASILDMLVEWATRGTPTTINRLEKTDPNGRNITYPAFRIAPAGVEIYDAAGYEHPLIRLHTKTEHSLWLMKSAEPASGLALNNQVQRLLSQTERRFSNQWPAGVVIPMLEMDLEADVEWMLGTTAFSPTRSEYYIKQVFQQFKLRANEKGARVKVVTGMVMATACAISPPPPPYILNDPFIGFFTQPGNDALPLAAFWADTDVWQNPEGTLEEL